MFLRLLCVHLFAALSTVDGYTLTLLHTNDVQARVEQFNKYGSDCSSSEVTDGKCFGGVARRYTKIKEIIDAQSADSVLLMDAGNQFMGTMWFSAYKGKEASYFMNKLGYEIMVGTINIA